MSIIYNTFRKDKYLRTLFTQGRYLLASENSDLELEVFDFIRNSFRNNIGNIAIGDAWKVSVYSSTQLLISPGESWYDGLPFNLSMGDDWILTLGNTPSGVTLADAPAGLGKLLTFATGTVPTGTYRVVINAVEQQINSTEDPFLQNINVPEPTASKIRLVYTINIVTDSNQGQAPSYDTSSPVPYQGEVGSYSSVNLSNTIQINPSSSSGYLISTVDVSGSGQIDGRSVELTISNPSGANPFPVGTTDQAQFENGTFYDANGSEYHINAIFNATTSGQVVIRLSNQVGQSDPVLPSISGSPSGFVPYYITKQDVYYTDDSTGLPTGVLHWHIAKASFDTTNGFLHASSVTDLRDSVVSQAEFQKIIAAKFDLTIADGGVINFSNDAKFLSWSSDFTLVNPSGQPQTIPANTLVILPGGSVVYQTDLLSSTPTTLGFGNQNVTVTSSGSSLVLSGTPNFSTMHVGNAIGVNTYSVTFSPSNVNTSTSVITATGHTLKNADIVVFTSSGTLPTGLSPNVSYYVMSVTSNTFQVSEMLGGIAVAFSTQGSGTHTAWSKFSATSSITSINSITQTLSLASSVTGTGPALIFQDSYAASEVPSDENTYTLAVYGTSDVVVGGRIQLSPSQNNVIYDERTLYPSGLAAFTNIVIPFNSRNFSRQQYFDLANHNLEIYVNQLLKYQTTGLDTADWSIVNNDTIQFNYALPANAEVHYRMDSLPAGSLGSSSGGGGGGGNLQAAYDAGNNIATTTGVPVTIGGTGTVAVFNGDVLVNGEVITTSAILTEVTSGQALSANTSYLVRWGIPANTETPNEVYRATAAVASNSQYQVIGITNSTSAISIGTMLNLCTGGSYTVASGDGTFNASQIGQPVYLKNDGTGGFTTTAVSTVGDVQLQIGVVQSATQIWISLKDIGEVVPIPQYDERILYPSGLAASTSILIPVNSRNSGVQETYSTAGGDLEVYVNQQLKYQPADWTAIDTTHISFTFALPNDTEVHFRKNPLSSGVLVGSGGGGGSQTLQDTYDLGNSITTITGVPFTVNGPSGKIAVFNGDIEVTGVVDPTGVQLTPQSSNPLGAGQAGIWVNSSGQLTHTDGTTTTNISQVITEVVEGTAQTTISNTYQNLTDGTIPAFSAIYTPSAGNAGLADGTTTNKFQVIGVTPAAITASSSGPVAYSGYLTGVSGLTHGVYVYLGLSPGTLTSTPPTTGGGYPTGFNVVKIGIMDGTNLILQIQHIGTL